MTDMTDQPAASTTAKSTNQLANDPVLQRLIRDAPSRPPLRSGTANVTTEDVQSSPSGATSEGLELTVKTWPPIRQQTSDSQQSPEGTSMADVVSTNETRDEPKQLPTQCI